MNKDDDLGLLCKKCGDIWQTPFAICPTCKSEEIEPVFIQDGGEITELIYMLRENDILDAETRSKIVYYLRSLMPSVPI